MPDPSGVAGVRGVIGAAAAGAGEYKVCAGLGPGSKFTLLLPPNGAPTVGDSMGPCEFLTNNQEFVSCSEIAAFGSVSTST